MGPMTAGPTLRRRRADQHHRRHRDHPPTPHWVPRVNAADPQVQLLHVCTAADGSTATPPFSGSFRKAAGGGSKHKTASVLKRGPDDIHIGDDIRARPDVIGRVGHDSAVIANEPRVAMISTLDLNVPLPCRSLTHNQSEADGER